MWPACSPIALRSGCRAPPVRAASLVLIAEITVHAIAATVVIGWEAGFHYLMLPVVPV